jgi:hypothetical protein
MRWLLLVVGCGFSPVDISSRRSQGDMATQSHDSAGHMVGSGGLCGPADDCGAGNTCTAIPMGISYCTQDCNRDADCTQPTVAGGIAPVCLQPGAGLKNFCTPSCNPVGAADGTQGCPARTACLYDLNLVGPGVDEEVSVCVAPGTIGEAGDCSSTSCAPGLFCIDSVCRRVCRLGSSTCPAGQTCQAPIPASVLPSPRFGVCS